MYSSPFGGSTARSRSVQRARPGACGGLFWTALVFALVCPAAVRAAPGVTDEPGPNTAAERAVQGFEFGPTFSLPLAAASANREVLGLDAGVTCTMRLKPRFGVGLDAAYHYWPVSTDFKEGFSRRLRLVTLGGSAWGLQIRQLGGHVRLETPVLRDSRAWLQLGLNSYRIDPNTTGYEGDAGLFWVSAPPLEAVTVSGYSISAAVERVHGPGLRVGLDVTYHRVSCEDEFGQNLEVFTLGAHTLFGW